VFVNHGDDGATKAFVKTLRDERGYIAHAPYSGTVYDLAAGCFTYKAEPKPIAHITFGELRELAFMGAAVLHEDSVQPVKEKGIALNIRNTNRPEDPGTMILDKIEEDRSQDRFITGIAGRKNFTILTLSKRNMNQSSTLRNALDDADILVGISTPDAAGNVLSEDLFYYDEATRCFYALNGAVTAENYELYLDATAPNAKFNFQLSEADAPVKHVWLDIFNSTDNFLNSTYLPQLQNYDGILNLDVEYVSGDGQNEGAIVNKLQTSVDDAEGYAINMVKTDNAAAYISVLE
jgi:hypothetical protein